MQKLIKLFIKQLITSSLFISMLATANPASQSPPIKVTVLGSANVAISPDQFGPSILVQAGGQTFLFDAGRGVPIRIKQAGVEFADVDKVFLTHLHSDHVVGLPDLWMMGWMAGRQ